MDDICIIWNDTSTAPKAVRGRIAAARAFEALADKGNRITSVSRGMKGNQHVRRFVEGEIPAIDIKDLNGHGTYLRALTSDQVTALKEVLK